MAGALLDAQWLAADRHPRDAGRAQIMEGEPPPRFNAAAPLRVLPHEIKPIREKADPVAGLSRGRRPYLEPRAGDSMGRPNSQENA